MKDQRFAVCGLKQPRCRFEKTGGLFLRFVKKFEQAGCFRPVLGWIYFRLFYKKMLEREIAGAGIDTGMNVLHVGCGPLPMTAIELARRGARVTAVDFDWQVLSAARRAVCRAGVQDRVSIADSCGTRMDFSCFDAIWLSLHVRPMDIVLARAVNIAPPGAKIVFRTPARRLSRYYPQVDISCLPVSFQYVSVVHHLLFKKSIIIAKDGRSG